MPDILYRPDASGKPDKEKLEMIEGIRKKGGSGRKQAKMFLMNFCEQQVMPRTPIIVFSLSVVFLLSACVRNINSELLTAAGEGNTMAVQALLNEGADVNTKGFNGNTALMNATENGHIDTVKLLLDKGADINIKDKNDYTVMIKAAFRGDTGIIKLFAEKVESEKLEKILIDKNKQKTAKETSADSEKKHNRANGHYYLLFDRPASWPEAKVHCEYLGGHLATITSQEENDFVSNYSGVHSQMIWLGGTDEAIEGTWKWVTGEPWSYTNWLPGQPDNHSPGQDYLILSDNPKWDDNGLPGKDIKLSFICEWESFEKIYNPAIGHYH